MFGKQIVNSKNKVLGLTLLNPASNMYLFHNTRNKALVENKTFLWHLQGQHFVKKKYRLCRNSSIEMNYCYDVLGFL